MRLPDWVSETGFSCDFAGRIFGFGIHFDFGVYFEGFTEFGLRRGESGTWLLELGPIVASVGWFR